MNPNQMKLAILVPIVSVLIVAVIGGGLGLIFIGTGKAGAGEWGAVIIGLALVVLVPFVAFLFERMADKGAKA
jgi:tellurite resistance protein TehA-like permease